MRKLVAALVIMLIIVSGAACGKESGLVVHYTFDEGSGSVARDTAAGSDAQIHGAAYVKLDQGYALEFNGIDNYVTRHGNLGLKDGLTVEAWVKPHSIPVGEPGIVGTGNFYNEFFGLTYYESGGCYFYVSTGANNCTSKLAPGSWHHVAGTFDGKKLCLYIDGRLVYSRVSLLPEVDNSDDLIIGRNGEDYFKGMIDEVKIYNRALSIEEIRKEFESQVQSRIVVPKSIPLVEPQVLNGEGFSVRVGKDGGTEIEVAGSIYALSSSFSHPGKNIGWNSLSAAGDSVWSPKVTKTNAESIEVIAECPFYSLERSIGLDGGRVRMEDTITNLGTEPVGVLVQHSISGDTLLRNILLGGGEVSAVSMIAENPTVFLSQPTSSIGVLADDNVSRLQFEASSSIHQAKFGIRRFSVDTGKSRTIKWTFYPYSGETDYFEFVNQIRRDWNANVTVQGPFDWIATPDPDDNSYGFIDNLDSVGVGIARAPLGEPDKLSAYLQRKKLGIVGLMPYIGYYTGAPLTREQFKARIQKAMEAIKAVDPSIKFIGCTENNIVSYDRAKMPNGAAFDDICLGTGEYPLELSEEQTRIVKAEVPWGDSLVFNKNGRAMIEDCSPTSFIHTMVYQASGNYHSRHLMDMAKFLMEDVGMDGVYMDHFNMAWENTQRYDYSKWDGLTVDIDPNTGEIERKYTDAALACIEPMKELCDYIFSRDGVFVVNTHNVAMEMQSMPIMHFEEVGSNADPNSLQPGEEPPLNAYIAKLQLDSPIGLGIPSSNKERPDLQNAEEVYKTVLVYLRHGLLYYHNMTKIPETGPGSGEYGLINRMFPITPEELHKGWIKGKERIITAVSIDTLWTKSGTPVVHVFDLTGRPVDAADRCSVSNEDNAWRIRLDLKDWQEIAVVE